MGTLLVAGTPIGNLGDVSRRLVEELRTATMVACEDTRDLRKLCSALTVPCPPHVSLFEHNESNRIDELLSCLDSGGKVVLVSSAGTPLVSDPGYRVVSAALARGHSVSPVPGPCAAIAALSCSGLRSDRFAFLGFPPRKPGKRMTFLKSNSGFDGTLIFYESPHRVAKLALEACEVYGDVPAVLARELTKVHEEFLRMPLKELASRLAGRTLKGECVLLVELRGDSVPDDDDDDQSRAIFAGNR